MSYRRLRSTPDAGFTILELMMVVVVAAILTALALPSFIDAIARNRITSQTNDLVAALSLARTEALRRNRLVSVCTTNNNTSCSGDWNDGWLVWADDDENGVVNAPAEVLRVGEFSAKDTATPSGSVMEVQFNARGGRSLPTGGTAFTLDLKPANHACSSDPAATRRRVISVSITGAIASRQPGTCS